MKITLFHILRALFLIPCVLLSFVLFPLAVAWLIAEDKATEMFRDIHQDTNELNGQGGAPTS